MSSFNLAALEQTGVLSEVDYGRISRSLVNSINGLRVSSIRKALQFEPHEYTEYEKSTLENFDRKHRPVVDPDFAFDFATVPITLKASFDLVFFPDFVREYTCPDILDKLIGQPPVDDHTVVSKEYFRSLVLASFQLEQEIKSRYLKTVLARDLSGNVEVETTWMLPAKLAVDIGDKMTVLVTYFVLFD